MTHHQPSDHPFDLTGRRALISGGSGGIGAAIAEGFLEAGASVVITGRTERVHAVADHLAAPGRDVHGVRADLGERSAIHSVLEEAVDAVGGLDILVTCHGTVAVHPSLEHPSQDWDRVLAVNLTATFELCRIAGRTFVEQGHGKIINIASMYAFTGGLRVAAYTASKGGVAQLTKALANEWASLGVNVNAIAPGYVRTSLNEHVWGDPVRNGEILSRLPVGRWAEPADMKGPAVFLASSASDYVHGVVLAVDGGFLAR